MSTKLPGAKTKRLFAVAAAFCLLTGSAAARVRIDVKTHFLEKAETLGLKHGVCEFLEREGFAVVETGEDYCLWLERADERKTGEHTYDYSLRLALTRPSLARRRASLAERDLTFSYVFEPKLLSTEDSFWRLIREKAKGIHEREMIRAFQGGRAVAAAVKAMVASLRGPEKTI